MNYYCTGSSIGNLIMSLKHEEAEGQEFLRIMLRYNETNTLVCSIQVFYPHSSQDLLRSLSLLDTFLFLMGHSSFVLFVF